MLKQCSEVPYHKFVHARACIHKYSYVSTSLINLTYMCNALSNRYMHIHVHVAIYVYICGYLCIHICVYLSTYIYIYIYLYSGQY